jgi:hypothetical protein
MGVRSFLPARVLVACLAILGASLTVPHAGAGRVYEVSVVSKGAVPDDGLPDTRAVNRANDDVAKHGGGRVYFPPGRYIVKGAIQSSGVEFYGSRQAILADPDSQDVTPMVSGERRTTSGEIAKGSKLLTVSDVDGIEPGVLVAIRGAGGRSTVQSTTVLFDPGPSAQRLVLGNGSGFSSSKNYLFIENEIIRYDSRTGNTLNGVARGQFGTTPIAHTGGAPAKQANVLYASVVSVSGDVVTLDRPARASVWGAPVFVGSKNLTVTGLTFDGNTDFGDPHGRSVPLSYELARHVTIRQAKVMNGNHGGILLTEGTSDSLVEDNVLADNGAVSDPPGGAAIWVFGGGHRNVIRNNRIGTAKSPDDHTFYGIWLDDRSDESNEWNARNEDNMIVGNEFFLKGQTGGNAGISVDSGWRNDVRDNTVSGKRGIAGPTQAIRIWSYRAQGTDPEEAKDNVVEGNTVSYNQVGLDVCDGCLKNTFRNNHILEWSETPILDPNTAGNRYEGNFCDGSPCP